MTKSIIGFLRENKKEVEVIWKTALEDLYTENHKGNFKQLITELSFEKSVEIIEEYCKTGNVEKISETLIKLNKPPHKIFQLIELFETSIYDALLKRENDTTQEILEMIKTIRSMKKTISVSLLKKYENKYEEIIQLQRKNLKQLSSPVMRVLEKVIAIPIIGSVDEELSKQLIEKVLYAVVENKSEIILIDITGVTLIDSVVAYHLVQLVNAIHIVGGKSMLVGIKPEIAQTLVKLGVDLSNVVTLGTLKEGIELAMQYTNKEINEVNSYDF